FRDFDRNCQEAHITVGREYMASTVTLGADVDSTGLTIRWSAHAHFDNDQIVDARVTLYKITAEAVLEPTALTRIDELIALWQDRMRTLRRSRPHLLSYAPSIELADGDLL